VLEILPLLLPVSYLAFVSFQLGRIDVLEHRLPNRFTLRLFLLTVPSIGVAFLFSQSIERLLWALGLGLGTALIGLLLGATGGLGLGDVKLMISLNLLLGWISPWLAAASNALAVLSAGILGTLNLLKPGGMRAKHVAFGPYLLASFFVTFVYALFAQVY
jgi:leader peptidase (prepilin peptidase)/N-methyltransferase